MDTASAIVACAAFPIGLFGMEPHLSRLQQAMLDATPDCIKLLSVDGRLLRMNRAGCAALGIAEDSGFGMAWLPLLSEDVQHSAEEALQTASAGHSARFAGRSESAGRSTYWDNLLTPVTDASGRVVSILCVSRDVTAQTELERELEAAIDREKLLAREMQHRIKNMFSVVVGLIGFAEKEAAQSGAPDSAMRILRDKLQALSRASDAAFLDASTDDGANGQADLETIVRSVLHPYGDRCVTEGSPISIPAPATTTLALFLHELATNAVKYGALCTDMGRVTIRWTREGAMVKLVWTETGGPEIAADPERQGFGSGMIDRIVRSVGGRIGKTWRPEGLVVTLHLSGIMKQ